MDLSQIPIDLIIQQGVFAVLFVWLFISTRKESKEREDRLMSHVETTTVTLDKLSQRMENVSTKVDHIDTRLTIFENKKGAGS